MLTLDGHLYSVHLTSQKAGTCSHIFQVRKQSWRTGNSGPPFTEVLLFTEPAASPSGQMTLTVVSFPRASLCCPSTHCTIFLPCHSGLHGPHMLQQGCLCERRVPLLCGMGRHQLRDTQSHMLGPVLRPRNLPPRHRALQL